jgi:hypothetical protein
MNLAPFARVVCCIALLGASASRAEPFGSLSSWQEPSPLGRNRFLADPAIANWLMRLPPLEDWPEPRTTEAALSRELFDVKLIGGEAYHFAPHAWPNSPASLAQADVARQVFDATLMGGEPDRFTHAASLSAVIAQNIPPPPRLEGRSASGAYHPGLRRNARPRVIPRHAGRCTCAPRGAIARTM